MIQIQGKSKTEVIAIASGKGGTGKTLFGACLGYALTYSGHRVLMIDADLATYGLSLYLLGPQGKTDIGRIARESTWRAVLEGAPIGDLQPQTIRRNVAGKGNHGISYEALVADLGIYGDSPDINPSLGVERKLLQKSARAFLDHLRERGDYDYVLIDTRGGFSYESTDLCALADSFIVVTDADYSSFYQDRNLMRLINQSAESMDETPVLRSIIVNRATEGDEEGFRLALTREFPIEFEETHPIPLDIDAMKAYKTQECPYVVVPDSYFSYATMEAFRKILHVVTANWAPERVEKWNELVEKVSKAIRSRNEEAERTAAEGREKGERLLVLEQQVLEEQRRIGELERERDRVERVYEREAQRLREPLSARHVAPSTPVLVILALASLLIALLSFLLWKELPSTSERRNQLMLELYSTQLPPSLKNDYFKELLESGLLNFDNLDLPSGRLANLAAGGIRLQGAKLVNVDLENADLRRADLRNADLGRANLKNANLREAELERTRLVRADLRGARLESALLGGADLTDALIAARQLTRSRLDSETILPHGEALGLSRLVGGAGLDDDFLESGSGQREESLLQAWFLLDPSLSQLKVKLSGESRVLGSSMEIFFIHGDRPCRLLNPSSRLTVSKDGVISGHGLEPFLLERAEFLDASLVVKSPRGVACGPVVLWP